MPVTRRRSSASSTVRRPRVRSTRSPVRLPIVGSDVAFLDTRMVPPAKRTRLSSSRDTIAPKRNKRVAKVARTKRKLASIRDNRYAKRKGPGRTRTMV